MLDRELFVNKLKEILVSEYDYSDVDVGINENTSDDNKHTLLFEVSATKQIDSFDIEYDYEDSYHNVSYYTGYVPSNIVEYTGEDFADTLCEVFDGIFEDLGEELTSSLISSDGEDISDGLTMTVYKGDYWNPDDSDCNGDAEVRVSATLEIKEY